jgi:hypothetical protein
MYSRHVFEGNTVAAGAACISWLDVTASAMLAEVAVVTQQIALAAGKAASNS